MDSRSYDAALAWLASVNDSRLLADGLRGLEKECLRVGSDGHLSSLPHGTSLGSALTHPWLTTDYSEALLEIVTPPFTSSRAALDFLAELHAFVIQHSGQDLLWPASMPCLIQSDEAVPIAQYGPSNEGRLRTVYRSGLGHRYGRAMQAIAGVHFNYSLPSQFWPAWQDFLGADLTPTAFRSETLLGLARNFRRCGWILTYLFGASPAFSKTFRPAGHSRLESLDPETWYGPYSTSLRMSDMGYRNSTQARLSISLNSLDEFLAELRAALTTRDERYAAIGIESNGEYRQLNANILQLENEYYSSVRPKPEGKDRRLVNALAESGVEYLEVRTLDLNPFEPSGLALEQADLIELLLLYCLLGDSPAIAPAEQDEIDRRDITVAWSGRQPGLELPRGGDEVRLDRWANEILDGLQRIADFLDDADGRYRAAITAARSAVRDPEATLSGRMLAELRSGGQSFFAWAMALAEMHRQHFLAYPFTPGRLEELQAVAAESLAAARALEAADTLPFRQFLAQYLDIDTDAGEAAAR